DLATATLPGTGLPAAEVTEVARLVLLTRDHSPEFGDDVGALLSDADLAVLGRNPSGYARYLQDVRAEYAHVTEPDWRIGRSAVVQHLLDRAPLFHTPTGTTRWEEPARANLSAELEVL